MIGAIARLLGVSQALVWAVAGVGLAAGLVATVALLRADAVDDYKDELDAKAARNRIEVKERAEERTRDVQDLDDDSLFRRLLKRVRGVDDTAE